MIAFAVSYLFFQKQRDAATANLHHRFSGKAKPLRTAGEVEDANAEDALLDANPDVAISNDAKNPQAAELTRPAGQGGYPWPAIDGSEAVAEHQSQ